MVYFRAEFVNFDFGNLVSGFTSTQKLMGFFVCLFVFFIF